MSSHFLARQKFSGKPFALLSQSFSSLVFVTIAAFLIVSTAWAAGPLTVGSANPRYFFNSNGAPVYLAGTYLRQDAIKPGIEDFTAYLDVLQQQKHNFTRLWAWEQTPESATLPCSTLPYERTGSGLALDGGSKFDLRRLNQAYFDQLRARVAQAQQRGIYVSVVLFQSLNSSSQKKKSNPWTAHPFNRDNNVNGMNGDANGNGLGEEIFTAAIPAVTSLQETYIRKVVDTLNDFDNVLYEINGDGPLGNAAWQYYVINYLKNYQATKLKQHPVGIGYLPGTDSDIAFNSPADWIAFYNTDLNPPLALGNKVLVLETNPSLLGDRSSHQSIWKSFARGFNVIDREPDSLTPGVNENLHAAITQSLAYSEIINLSAVKPNDVACSTGYCLMNPGTEYLSYLPVGGSVVVDLSGTGQRFLVNWFNPISGETIAPASTVGGSQITLKSPFTSESVLYMLVQPQTQSQSVSSSTTSGTSSGVTTLSSSNVTSSSSTVSTPTITPNGGSFAGSVSVSLAGATAGAKIYYTVDGSTPTQSSSQYSSPVTISSNVLLKAKAFKNKLNPSAVASVWFAKTSDFDFTLSNSSSLSVVAGSSISNTISATLAVGSSQSVSFKVSGLPSSATGTFSASSCTPTCSSTLNISTGGATPAGSSTITVSASGGGVTKTTTFTLTVSAPVALTVATPTISPNGGSFTNSVDVTMATATSGASIYYTTDGSSPTQSSKLYTGAMTLKTSAVVKAKGFKSGYNPSAEVSASFTSDLVAYWKFDEAAGITAADSSGNGNTGTLANGPYATPGILGGAFYFDGVDDNVTVLDSPSLNPANAFTLSAWVNPAVESADFRAVFAKNYTYYLYSSASGYCGNGSVVAGFGEGATGALVCDPTPLATYSWTYLALTYDGSKLTLYRNGSAVATAAASGAVPVSTGTLQIGASQYGEFFTGLIDEVRVYNRALNGTAIAAAYEQATPYNFAISSMGNLSVMPGSSFSNSISATLTSGIPQPVSFSVSGLPSGATGSFSAVSCTPTCSTNLNITTSGATPVGTSTVTVSAFSGGFTKTTTFTLTVSSAVQSVATPTISPSGGTFTSAITVPLATTTPGASIYYTTDGSAPTQSSRLYSAAINVSADTRVKAKAFKSGYDPSPEASAQFTILPFNFSISTSGGSSINAGASTTQTVSTTLVSGSSQTVSFSVSGLPVGAASSFSLASCTPTCSTVLTITTTGSTPAGSYPITITAAGGAVIRSALFNLSVTAALVVATPTLTPNGGAFSDSVSVAIQSPTSGATIYYTTDGSSPTVSSLLYTGPMTLTDSATVNAVAFKTGYTQSALASASFAVSSSSIIYYVSKNGSDSNSCAQARTSNAPKLTISAALACIGTTAGAGAGYTVEVGAGIYNERLIGNIPGGSSWTSPFTLRAKAGNAVTIKPNFSLDLPILEPHSSYAIIQGFILDGSGQTGVMVRLYGSYQRLLNNELKNVDGDNGIFIANGAHYNEIIGGSIHDGRFAGCWTCGGGGTSYPIYLEGNNNLIQGVHIYNFPSFGIHVNNGYPGNHADSNIIRNNRIHHGGTTNPSACGIIVSREGGTANNIYNNIIYNMSSHGLCVSRSNHLVYNNTIYGNAQIGIYVNNSTSIIVKNNIVVGNSSQIVNTGTGTILSNNLTTGDPQFVAPGSANFRVQISSPAIDAGANLSPVVTTDIDATPRPKGSGFDIGAYEY
jgi:hypothetical protein